MNKLNGRFQTHRRVVLLIMLLGCLCLLPQTGWSYQRIVLLNTAVGPILKEMGLDSSVVGITYNDETFSDKTKIGSHLSPNIELMKALRPDLIIAGSKRAFSDERGRRFRARIFRYDPRSLSDILNAIRELGNLLDKAERAENIIKKAQLKLSAIKKPEQSKTVVYEISQRPLKVAGQLNIIHSIITAAGGTNLVTSELKHVLISAESVLLANPDFYIFQNGPMNKNPSDPLQRNYFKTLKSRVVEVEQLAFTRPGLNAFEAVVKLNSLFFDQ